MAVEINLPGSSLEELQKIIMAYAAHPDKAPADSVGKMAGVDRTTVSRNAKFLVDTGILTSGAQKASTDLGRALARSIDHSVLEDSQKHWKDAVRANENVSNLLTTLRI